MHATLSRMPARVCFRILACCIGLVTLQAQPKAAPPPDKAADPKHLLQLAIEALGSEAKVKAIKTLKLEWTGHTLLPEQSERPEGPFLTKYQQAVEEIDLENLLMRQVLTTRSITQPKGAEITYLLSPSAGVIQASDAQAPAPPSVVLDNMELCLQLPYLALNAAKAAADIRLAEETKYQGVPHHLLVYKPGKTDVKIWLNASTNLPTAIEWTTARPGDVYWSGQGDIVERLIFGSWALEGGILFPRQWNIERNGKPWSQRIYTVITFNPALDKKLFEFEATPRRASVGFLAQTMDDVPLGRQNEPALPIRNTFILVPGAYNVAMIRQDDGVVVLEAPISSGYSRKVMEDVLWRFREAPVKAVITTSDSWSQLGGIREYIAAGIPIYALDLNQNQLELLASQPHTLLPDRLFLDPRQPTWNLVAGKTVISSSLNPIELYPLRGEASERTLMAYFPELKLLWSGDLVNRNADGSFFMPAYLGELVSAVRRERLDVQTIFGLHMKPTPYKEIAAAWYRALGVPAPETMPSNKSPAVRTPPPKTVTETPPGLPTTPASKPPAVKASSQAKPGNQ